MSEETKIVLSVDTTQVEKAGIELDRLASAGKRTEGAAQGLETNLQGVNKAAAGVSTAVGKIAASSGEAASAIGRTQGAALTLGAALGTVDQKISGAADGMKKVGGASEAVAAALGKSSAASASTAKSLDGVGKSAGLAGYQAAQMSAQLQDLFVQVQAGGSPMTALIQQGSQLSAVFGGFRPALAAVGALFTPVVSGALAAGAAVGALAYGFVAGRNESAALAKQLSITGNAVGLTEEKFNDLAKTISTGTKTSIGSAKDTLLQLASSGQLSGAAFAATAEAVQRFSKATGQSTEEVAKQFVGLTQNVVGGAETLNRTYNFLTAEQFKYIKSLDETGRTQEAIKTTFDALSVRLADQGKSLKVAQGFWESLGIAISNVGEGLKNLFKDDQSTEKLRSTIASLEKRTSPEQKASFKAVTGNDFDAYLAGLKKELETKTQISKVDAQLAIDAKEKAARDKAGIDLAKLADQNDAPSESLKKRLALIETYRVAAGKTEQEVAALVAAEVQKSEAGALSVQSRLVRLDAASAIAAAASSARLQSIQDAVALGKIREVDGIEQTTQAIQDRIKVEKALLEQRLREIPANERNAPTALAIKLDIGAKDFEAANELTKGSEALAVALYKVSRASDAVTLALRDQHDAERAAATTNSDAELRKIAKALDDKRIALNDNNEALRLEASLIGESSVKREFEIEQLKIQQRLEKELKDIRASDIPPENKTVAISQATANAATEKAQALTKIIDKMLDPKKADRFGDALKGAFGKGGAAFGQILDGFQAYAIKQKEIADAGKLIEQSSASPEEKFRLQTKLSEESARSQIGAYADIAGAAKGFFNEHSKGYKALQTAEAAFRAYQLASDLVKGTSAAAVAVATQAQGDPYTAFARMAAMAAAMTALGFAVRGGGQGGNIASSAQRQGGAATGRVVTTDQLDPNSATFVAGTVLGDASARSASIANSLKSLGDTSKIQLTTQTGMLAALKVIESSMAGLASIVARNSGLTTGKNLGIVEGKISVNKGDPILNALGINDFVTSLPIIGGIVEKLQSLWGNVKQSITDSGLTVNGSVADLSAGRGVQQFADVQTTKSSFFGLVKNVSTAAQFGPVGDELAQQFGLIFKGIGDTLKSAATSLGKDGATVGEAVAQFVVDIPRLSLKGLSGTALQEAISSAISSMADTVAHSTLSGLDDFRKIGEGYFETLVRVASSVDAAQFATEQLRIATVDYTEILNKQGDVSAEIVRQSIAAFEAASGSLSSVGAIINDFTGSADEIAATYTKLLGIREALVAVGANGETLTAKLVRSAGGLDSLGKNLDGFLKNYFTSAEQVAAQTSHLGDALARLGIDTLPKTRDAFRDLVQAQDLTTDAGLSTYAALLSLQGAFADLYPVIDTAAIVAQDLTAAAAAGAQALDLITAASQRMASANTGVTSALRALADFGEAIKASIADVETAISDVRSRAAQLVVDGKDKVATALQALANSAAEAAKTLAGAAATVTAARAAQLSAINAIAEAVTSQRAAITQAAAGVAQAQQAIVDAYNAATAQVNTAADAVNAALAGRKQAADAALQAVQTAQQAITQAYLSASAQVNAAADAVNAAVATRKQAADAALQAVQTAQQAITQAYITAGERVKAAARGLLAEVAAKGSAKDAAALSVSGVREKITSAFLASQSDYEAALKRLAGLQTQAADKTTKLADTMAALSSSVGDFLASITGAVDSGSIAPRLDVARASFETTAALAKAGDSESANRLIESANAFLDASKTNASSGAAFDADVRRVRQVLSEFGGVAKAAIEQSTAPDNAAAIAEATAEVARTLAETERLRSIANAAGAALVARQTDLLGEYTSAQAALTAATVAYQGAVDSAAAFGLAISGASDSLADAATEMSAASAALNLLGAQAASAGAATAAAPADLLATFTAADTAYKAALASYESASLSLAGLGISAAVGRDAFESAVAAFGAATAALAELGAQATIAGAATANAPADLLATFRSADEAYRAALASYENAAAATTGLGIAAALSVDAFDSAVAAFQAATTALNTPPADLLAAQADAARTLADAQGELDRLLGLVAAAGIDLALAVTKDSLAALVADYQKTSGDLSAAIAAQALATVSSADAAALLAAATAQAAAAGVQSADVATGIAAALQTFNAALADLALAQANAKAIGAEQVNAARTVVTEFAELAQKLATLRASLDTFTSSTATIDFSGLAALDPLGDLLKTYADAVRELVDATADNGRLNATGEFVDIGNGFSRYTSTGGATAIHKDGVDGLTVFGKDGRIFSDATIRDFVSQKIAEGNLGDVYRDAVAFGISSGDLEKLTGSGTQVLNWALSQGLPAFAKGGAHYGGLRIVGEGGPELEATGPARYWSASQTETLLGGGSMVSELRELRAEIQRMREEQDAANIAIASNTLRSAKLAQKWDDDGLLVRGENSQPIYTTAAA